MSVSLLSFSSIAHSDDINQATLSLDNSEHYQLVVTIDFIHLLKKHLAITGDDAKVIDALKQRTFFEQKQLLDNVQKTLSHQTSIHFDSKAEGIGSFTGLQLQHLKRILSQQVNLSDYETQLYASGNIPAGVKEVALRFSPLLGSIVLKVVRPEQEMINTATLSDNYQISNKSASAMQSGNLLPTTITLGLDYIYQGFVHIIPRGLDHILFVLALLLFAKRRSTLIWQVSAFTLAHTITLALGIYGVIELSSAIVEPLIALSIVYVGLENIYRAKHHTVSQIRLPVIFVFGLLHGLGFASVLGDVGLPPSQYVLSLISFNMGVELGQLTVIALAFICLTPFRQKHWYQNKLVLALNIAIAMVAMYWLIERLV